LFNKTIYREKSKVFFGKGATPELQVENLHFGILCFKTAEAVAGDFYLFCTPQHIVKYSR